MSVASILLLINSQSLLCQSIQGRGPLPADLASPWFSSVIGPSEFLPILHLALWPLKSLAPPCLCCKAPALSQSWPVWTPSRPTSRSHAGHGQLQEVLKTLPPSGHTALLVLFLWRTLTNTEQPTRFFCPWNSSGKNTGMGNHSLLQGIFLTQGLSPDLLHYRWILY